MRETSKGLRVVRDYLSLTKPGIVLWLVITAYCAMVVGYRGVPPFGMTAGMVVGLGLSAGGAHAVNMWYDRDIDPLMQRTQDRPVAAGRIPARNALILGVAMGAAAVPILGWGVNWLTAAAALAGYLFYLFVYTFWLKRRTPQNIVIGGAAGAFPPLIGWVAVTGHLALAPLVLFAIIFFWTPPHFWSLALYAHGDYARAGVPMLPVVAGARATRRRIMLYTLLLVPLTLLPWALGEAGRIYGLAAGGLGIGFLVSAWRVLRDAQDEAGRSLTKDAPARAAFRYSILYLFVLFAALAVDRLVG